MDPYRSSSQVGTCPRCANTIESSGEELLACSQGCGEWFPRTALDAQIPWDTVVRAPGTTPWPWGATQCPMCRGDMAVCTAGDVRFDRCANDGVWLDAGEYERFMAAYYPYRRTR